MRSSVEDAENAATPPDPSIHRSAVSDLTARCRESNARITSLEHDIR